MLFRLVVERKGQRTRSIEVRNATARIGRAHGNDVRIPSAQVSRKHCELRERDGLVVVEDLESVNGTFLNEDLITGVAVVRPGDRVQIGPITFVVEYELTPKALERLRALDYEVVDGESDGEVVLEVTEAKEDTEVTARPRPRPRPKPAEIEEVVEAEEVTEEAQTSLMDLGDVSWKPPEEGDLHDLLSGLDHGAESMLPRKRPAPRKRDDGKTAPPTKKDGGGKRRPQAEE